MLKKAITTSLLVSSLALFGACTANTDGEIASKNDKENSSASILVLTENLKKKHPELKFDKINPSEFEGIYEIMVGQNVGYTDVNATYFLFGHLVDMVNKVDLTQQRIDEANKLNWSDMPFDASFSVVKGDGSRKIAVFSDPECPYCKKLEPELDKLNNVTIHYFPMPLGIHATAQQKIDFTWCSDDKEKTWKGVLSESIKEIKAKEGCSAPTEKVLAFAAKSNIAGTPAIIREDGMLKAGWMPFDVLDAWINTKPKTEK